MILRFEIVLRTVKLAPETFRKAYAIGAVFELEPAQKMPWRIDHESRLLPFEAELLRRS
jgi:hypothetical protein